jgi:LysR family transcriptional regulator for bpeEF and oprC
MFALSATAVDYEFVIPLCAWRLGRFLELLHGSHAVESRMDRLKALEIFKSVVDKGSFVKGAEALDVSCSVATRAVQDLESALGVRLLQRTTRSIALTAVGHEVLRRSTELLDQYRDIETMSSLSVSEAAGTVRLVAPASYGRQMLGPALASFRVMHPKVLVDLRMTDDCADVVDDEADLALCVGRDPRQSLIARRVGMARLGLYAAPSYLARRGTPRHPSELQSHDCLTCEGMRQGTSWEFHHASTRQQQAVTVRGVLSSNSVEALTSAAIHGAGIALLPDLLVGDFVQHARLQPVLQAWQAEPLGVYLAYSSRQHQPLRVRKLIDHLLEAIAAIGDAVAPPPPAPPRRLQPNAASCAM